MDTNEFIVEGRYFPNPLYAFTFASIQADRMDRPVEVHLSDPRFPNYNLTAEFGHRTATWHATAHPSNFVRSHLVTERTVREVAV